MQTTGHTVKAFDEELDQLRSLIVEMGGLAQGAISEAMRCLVERDLEGARRVVEADRRLDSLEAEADRRVIQLIALRAPLADDLREIIAALKIAGIIERIGDYAKNIAKRVKMLESKGEIEPLSLLPEMGRITAEMVGEVLEAFVERDSAKARRVCERDALVDDFYDSIFRALLTFMIENPRNITQSAHLLFVAKHLERIGDHATNIGEMVHYAATGEWLPERGHDGDKRSAAATPA
ncbi:MAG TPA: phosphate signaling complex protein PhoU [Allosphingosinicella sp.]|jgi:phosphate transport system protein